MGERRGHPTSTTLAPLLLVVGLAYCAPLLVACPVAPALPVEESRPNHPPFISEEFISPSSIEVTISRDQGIPRRFEVDPLLDVNENERLTIYWYSGDNLITSQQGLPIDGSGELHRDVFTFYTGASLEVDPCDPEWSFREQYALSVYVTDRPTMFTDQPQTTAGGFSDTFTWFITFDGECDDL